MLDAADALPLAVERAEPPWRQAVERSVQDHCDVSDKPEIGEMPFRLTIIEGRSSWRAPGSYSMSSPPSIISSHHSSVIPMHRCG
jgi:hypothetical protein